MFKLAQNNNRRLSKRNPAIIGRWVVAVILWLLLFFCFWAAVRANNTTTSALAHINNTITSDTIKSERLVGEVAKEYVQNWGTFSSDRDDYARRMKTYGLTLTAPPEGIQKCNSAIIISIENSMNNKSIYRINLLVNQSRIITVNKDQYLSLPPELIVSKDDDMTSYWKDFREAVEVTLRVNKDSSVDVIGTPVSKPLPGQSGVTPVSLIGTDEVPGDFKIFITQALELYFGGKNLDNYLSPGVKLMPVGQYQVKEVVVEGFRRKNDKAEAVVRVRLSTEGIKSIDQTIIVEAQKKERWMLSRLGGY